jgi:hypothetical protein
MTNYLLLILLLLPFQSESQENDFFKDNFNKSRMEFSDTYRYIILKNNITEFIKENSNLRKKNKISAVHLNKNYSDLCLDLYNGVDYLIKSTRESEICLKYATLSGYSNAPFYLAENFYKNNEYNKSILWLGLSAGLGYSVKGTPLYSYLKQNVDFKTYYKQGLINSINLPLNNYVNSLEIINNDYITNTIVEPRVFNPDNYYYHIYKYLKDFDYKSFVQYNSENTNSAEELITLSHINNQDWISFIKYCNNNIKDKKFKQYCLKQIYKNTGESKSLFRYSLNEYNFYKEGKLENNYHFKNFYFSLGIGKEQDNKYLILLMNNFFNQIENLEDFEDASINFNDGRKYVYSIRNIK